MTLPYEAAYAEGSQKKSPMKRLAVLIKPEKLESVVGALRSLHLEATIYDVKGAGKEKDVARLASGRGSGTFELAYNTRKIVATVVESDRTGDVVDSIKAALHGDKAVLIVSPIDGLIQL